MTHSNLHHEDDEQSCRTSAKLEFQRSLQLNAWLAVSVATYVATLFLLRRHPEWSPAWKATITLTPILPGLLYLRKGIQLLRQMDELQRRIQVEAWLFAALGTVVVGTIINVFNGQGLDGNWPVHGLEIGGTYLTMFILWSVGVTIAKLRYR
jgi:hypothetical protein